MRRNLATLVIAALVLAPLATFAACSSSSPDSGSPPGSADASPSGGGPGADGGGRGTPDGSSADSDATSSTLTDAGADAATDASASAPTPPAQAAAAGFTTLVFDQGGDAGWDIDLAQTNAAGHAWYLDGGFYGANEAVTQVDDGGVLTIASGGMTTATRLGSGPDAGYVGYAFGGGFYVEANVALTPGCDKTGIVSAFWSLPVEKGEKEPITDHWPGQASGYVHYVELDFLEFHLKANTPPSATFYAIDWYGDNANSTPTCPHKDAGFCQCANNGSCPHAPVNGADDLPDTTDFSAFNTYGALVVPSRPNTPDSGYTQGFFDDAKTPSHLQWDPYDAAIPPAPDGGQVYAVTDIEHFYLIANSSESCPMRLAYVRVWQR